jgi:hypothetical protein
MTPEDACKVSALWTVLNFLKGLVSTQSRAIIRPGYATLTRHTAAGLHHARSSGGPLRIDSQASTGISNVNTMTSR